MPDVSIITQLVSNLGFPICVTAYCLVTLKKSIDKNTDVINEFSTLMSRLLDRMNIDIDKEEEIE